jgi:predicted nucleic acid-binding protein
MIFVDCLSFALMRRHRIKTAFAFDRHFEIAGFKLLE